MHRIRRWIEACINEELPASVELEEALQNGIFLAKLGHFMSPDVVPLKKIYDKDFLRYKVTATRMSHHRNAHR